jgi:hypothetical protein
VGVDPALSDRVAEPLEALAVQEGAEVVDARASAHDARQQALLVSGLRLSKGSTMR